MRGVVELRPSSLIIGSYHLSGLYVPRDGRLEYFGLNYLIVVVLYRYFELCSIRSDCRLGIAADGYRRDIRPFIVKVSDVIERLFA